MALTNFAQIKGGKQLVSDVNALKTSYVAAKVLTTIAKEVAAGDPPVNYNADELLAELKTRLDALVGGSSGLSVASVNTAIETLKNKPVKDVVRMEFPVVSGVATLDPNFDTLVPSCDKTVLLPVYTTNNEIVFDENGDQLTINVATGAFSGIPSEIDVDASAADTNGDKVYKTKGNFTAKIFPTGQWTFGTLPTDALLDNNEMQLVAYKTALDQIVIELAKDQDLIDDIKDKIGTTAVQDQIDAALQTITDALALKADQTDLDNLNDDVIEIDSRLESVEKGQQKQKVDKINVTGSTPVTQFSLSKAPNSSPVVAYINHFVYREPDDFTVNRTTKQVTWTLTEANNGFDINDEITDQVVFKYFINAGEDTSAWSQDFVMDPGETQLDLKPGLSFDQEANMTDDNTMGTNQDGVGRKVHVYLVATGDMTNAVADPIELSWNADPTAGDSTVEAALTSAGFVSGTDFVYGTYALDSDCILNFSTGANAAKIRVSYEGE